MSWYVIYTNPKSEKKVADQLAKMGVAVYCPLVTQLRQWSDRKKQVQVPLFTSYVFVKVEEANRNIVFNVPGVVRYLFWLGKPAIVKDEEIDIIKTWLAHEDVDIEVENLREGDELEVKQGPFKNHKGIVQKITKKGVRLAIASMGIVLVINKNTLTE